MSSKVYLIAKSALALVALVISWLVIASFNAQSRGFSVLEDLNPSVAFLANCTYGINELHENTSLALNQDTDMSALSSNLTANVLWCGSS
jgi:hypothetical protein